MSRLLSASLGLSRTIGRPDLLAVSARRDAGGSLGGCSSPPRLSAPKIGLAGVVTFGACAVGAVVGFLFGVPKARTDGDGGGVRLLQDGSPDPGPSDRHQYWRHRRISGRCDRCAISLLVGSAVIAFQLVYMWTCTRLYDVFSGKVKDPQDNDPDV